VDTSRTLGDVQMYGFGDDPTRPPTLSADEVPYAVPLGIGLDTVMWADESLLPPVPDQAQIVGDGLWIPGPAGPPQVGRPYMMYHGVMGGDIPLDCDRSINFGFPTSVEGQEGWVSSFLGDTWQGGSVIPFVTCDPTSGWDFGVSQVFAGNRLESRNDVTGFAYVGRDTFVLGFERDPVFFGPVDGNVGYGWAGDVGDAVFGPESIRLVTAWPGQPMDGPFPAAQPERTINPGFDGLFDIVDIWPIVAPDGSIWLGLQTAEPWPMTPPDDRYFSQFIQWGVAYQGDDTGGAFFGWQIHAGEEELFGSGPQGPLTPELYIMDDGSLMTRTHLTYTEGDDHSITIQTDGGYLPAEDGQFFGTNNRLTFGPADLIMDEPLRHDGGFPVYDFVTGNPVEPPTTTTPPTEAVVTETSRPAAAAETTTTQPAATEETTTTTRPAVTTTPDEGGTTVPRTVERDPCWWCWGLIALFVLFLVCVIYIWFKSYEWWTCWLPWFLVIFIWVPFLLAGLW
ncbi:MAG: hypothetical protein ACE5E8_12275, partial [Acidimicrobiia bacterium]